MLRPLAAPKACAPAACEPKACAPATCEPKTCCPKRCHPARSDLPAEVLLRRKLAARRPVHRPLAAVRLRLPAAPAPAPAPAPRRLRPRSRPKRSGLDGVGLRDVVAKPQHDVGTTPVCVGTCPVGLGNPSPKKSSRTCLVRVRLLLCADQTHQFGNHLLRPFAEFAAIR